VTCRQEALSERFGSKKHLLSAAFSSTCAVPQSIAIDASQVVSD